MKEIGTMKPGTIFTYSKEKFVVLEQMGGGVFCLQAQSHESVSFAKGKSKAPNNYAESFLRVKIEKIWLQELIENGAKPEELMEFEVNLRETDGSRGYGTMTALAAPLTLWQYGKYKDIIPLNKDNWWWLATPWKTKWRRTQNAHYARIVWSVDTNGDCSFNLANGSDDVRPALLLNAGCLVSVDEDGKGYGRCDPYRQAGAPGGGRRR